MSMTTDSRRNGITQFVILAMSTFLLGLYFGHDLPNGVDLITLQTGLMGVMAFLSLNHLSRLSLASNTGAIDLNPVEQRLQRFVDNQGYMHRIDDAEEMSQRMPNLADDAVAYRSRTHVSDR